MNFSCPSCGILLFVKRETILLVNNLFSKSRINAFGFICDKCGERILANYRDTYGLGIG